MLSGKTSTAPYRAKVAAQGHRDLGRNITLIPALDLLEAKYAVLRRRRARAGSPASSGFVGTQLNLQMNWNISAKSFLKSPFVVIPEPFVF